MYGTRWFTLRFEYGIGSPNLMFEVLLFFQSSKIRASKLSKYLIWSINIKRIFFQSSKIRASKLDMMYTRWYSSTNFSKARKSEHRNCKIFLTMSHCFSRIFPKLENQSIETILPQAMYTDDNQIFPKLENQSIETWGKDFIVPVRNIASIFPKLENQSIETILQ